MKYWVWHLRKGAIAGPFKTRATALKRMNSMINESYGISLWLSVEVSIGGTGRQSPIEVLP